MGLQGAVRKAIRKCEFCVTWVSHLTSLGLSSIVCKMRRLDQIIFRVPSSLKACASILPYLSVTMRLGHIIHFAIARENVLVKRESHESSNLFKKAACWSMSVLWCFLRMNSYVPFDLSTGNLCFWNVFPPLTLLLKIKTFQIMLEHH